MAIDESVRPSTAEGVLTSASDGYVGVVVENTRLSVPVSALWAIDEIAADPAGARAGRIRVAITIDSGSAELSMVRLAPPDQLRPFAVAARASSSPSVTDGAYRRLESEYLTAHGLARPNAHEGVDDPDHLERP